MKKELPKIFKKDVSSSHDNNKKVYYLIYEKIIWRKKNVK